MGKQETRMASIALQNPGFGLKIIPGQPQKHLNGYHPVGPDQKLERLWSEAESLYREAARARELGRNYRGFRVGCAVLAFRPDADCGKGRYEIFSGTNVKIRQDIHKICAEPIAVLPAYLAGYTEIVGMFTVGEPQFDDHSQIRARTLHPCYECRQFLIDHPIIPRHMRIMTAVPRNGSNSRDKPWDEIHTLNQMLRVHGDL